MQTESAYPGGPYQSPTMHVERAMKLGLPDNSGRLLVIGPGTYHEVEALDKAVRPRELFVLTAFEGERAGLEQHCRPNGCIERGEVGDMHDTPFETAAYDLIFSSNVFEHAIAPHMMLLEMRRLLKPGGVLYFVVPEFETAGGDASPWHVYCFPERTWMSLLHKSGFAAEPAKRAVEDFGGGAVESYLHIKAIAVEPPAPMDELLRRIIKLKEQK